MGQVSDRLPLLLVLEVISDESGEKNNRRD